MIWHWLSAGLMLATALTHSILGERRLIGPLLHARHGVMANAFARTIMRYAWHVTSALMIATAVAVAWPGVPPALIQTIGAIWLALGIASLFLTRGKHVGWPALSAAGICALVAGA